MSDAQPIQLAPRMYTGLAAVGRDPTFKKVLAEDQYLFAAYMAAVQPVIGGIAGAGGMPRSKEWRKLMHDLVAGQEDKLIQDAAAALDDRNGALKMINELKQHLGAQLTAAYASAFVRFAEVWKNGMSRKHDVSAPAEVIGMASTVVFEFVEGDEGAIFDQNLRWLGNLVGLNQSEKNLITIATLQTVDPAANIFFRYLEHAIPGRTDLMDLLSIAVVFDSEAVFEKGESVAEVAQAARKALNAATSKPLAFGLVKYSSTAKRFGPVSEMWLSILFKEHDDIAGLCEEVLLEASERESASGALARMDDKDKDLVGKLIEVVKANPAAAKGCNLLCYGSRKFDKRTVVLGAVKEHVDGVYELRQRNVKDTDLPSVAWVAQERLRQLHEKTGKTYALIVDRAEDVLSRSMRRSSWMYDLFGSDLSADPKSKDRSDLDSDEHLLTESPTLTFWMTSNISSLAEEAVGRFFAHIEVKGGTRADRKAEVQKVAKELKLSDELVQTLSKYTELGSHQVRSAAALTKLLGEEGPAGDKRILSAVEASQKALDRTKTEEIRESVTKYDLGLLNLSGKFKIDKIITALQKKPSGTLCFYGLPGTGKTQLAEHIALMLDKPLLIKRASDILSKWVGESEQNIKKMFDEGLDEDAIVLLDEADSFMRDRSMAKNSWEVTQVNELLTRMERFPGVFICATNLFEALDAAALRRFTFKLKFNSLTEEQRVKMFENETGVTVNRDVDDPVFQTLIGIRYLTPGDFATVKRQANLLGDVLSPQDWLDQLNEEAKAKLQGIQGLGVRGDEGGGLMAMAKKGE